jgi:hypothetical protein
VVGRLGMRREQPTDTALPLSGQLRLRVLIFLSLCCEQVIPCCLKSPGDNLAPLRLSTTPEQGELFLTRCQLSVVSKVTSVVAAVPANPVISGSTSPPSLFGPAVSSPVAQLRSG